MIRLKNEIDIKYIKVAIAIGEKILTRMDRWIEPGITSKRLNKYIEHLIWRYDSKPSFKGYNGFPTASCISVNENIIHGIPNDIPLKNGDLVKIDIGINYKGYFSDQARTYVVGESSSLTDLLLVYATHRALEKAMLLCVEGNTIEDISKIIETTAEDFEVGILKAYYGHGVGFDVHEDPIIPNRAKIGIDKDVKLVKGMVLAIEPMFVIGKGTYIKNKDGSVIADGQSAHFERTIIIQ